MINWILRVRGKKWSFNKETEIIRFNYYSTHLSYNTNAYHIGWLRGLNEIKHIQSSIEFPP